MSHSYPSDISPEGAIRPDSAGYVASTCGVQARRRTASTAPGTWYDAGFACNLEPQVLYAL